MAAMGGGSAGLPYGLQAMLKEGHQHISGTDEAVLRSIEACLGLSGITRTSFGPTGAPSPPPPPPPPAPPPFFCRAPPPAAPRAVRDLLRPRGLGPAGAGRAGAAGAQPPSRALAVPRR